MTDTFVSPNTQRRATPMELRLVFCSAGSLAKTDLPIVEDVWLSLAEASITFLDTDAAFGSNTERTRAAKVRLESAVTDFAAYQGA